MIKITLVDADKATHELEVAAGSTLMEAARNNMIRGIDADCGGAAACGTCAMSFSSDWQHILQGRSEEEDDMLEFSVAEPEKCRLTCQIILTEEMNGLHATVETEQG
ncbi:MULTISPECIES: 2Fe-2S iron-sulfur cluster-binding protein [unclassified Ruegeria]|uniref:2Fe-2S iron-sulfur cluster-binding protein n=1 Tax=unclassified Ruegeria TaxID=2625375 RepID=UPI0014899AF4|nr:MULTISPECIES: 2Fe-2S iron-sulfur cluster-binding protein [unclassified Ruegeria]